MHFVRIFLELNLKTRSTLRRFFLPCIIRFVRIFLEYWISNSTYFEESFWPCIVCFVRIFFSGFDEGAEGSREDWQRHWYEEQRIGLTCSYNHNNTTNCVGLVELLFPKGIYIKHDNIQIHLCFWTFPKRYNNYRSS